MKRVSLLIVQFLFVGACAGARAQQPPAASPPDRAAVQPAQSSAIQKRIEAYLRNIYAWGPDVQLTFSPLRDSAVPGLYEVTIDLAAGTQKDSAKFYVSRDGRYFLRGDLNDLTKDPLAETRAKLHVEGNPSIGPDNARVILVEFADFECPACKQLHENMKGVLARHPEVRLVFKDFPLTQVHPWARTAAIAGRCVYLQDHQAFWKFYDAVYDAQELISAENAWDKMLALGSSSGVNADALKACLVDPQAAQSVDSNAEQAQQLTVTSTPTVFVNGRRAVGPDGAVLEQYINYELGPSANRSKPATP